MTLKLDQEAIKANLELLKNKPKKGEVKEEVAAVKAPGFISNTLFLTFYFNFTLVFFKLA